MTNRRDWDAIARDDELIESLRRGDPVPDDDPVLRLLARWRADIVDTPLPDWEEPPLVRGDDSPNPARTPGKVHTPDKLRLFTGWTRRRVASLVAACLLVVGGIGMVSLYQPTDPDHPLWPVYEFFRSDEAQSQEALADAEAALSAARRAMVRGQLEEAQGYLEEVERKADQVASQTDADRLRAEVRDLRDQLCRNGGPGCDEEQSRRTAEPAPTPETSPRQQQPANPTTAPDTPQPAPSGTTGSPSDQATTSPAPTPSRPSPMPTDSAGAPPVDAAPVAPPTQSTTPPEFRPPDAPIEATPFSDDGYRSSTEETQPETPMTDTAEE